MADPATEHVEQSTGKMQRVEWVMAVTTAFLFVWPFLRGSLIGVVHSWIVAFDMVILVSLLHVGRAMTQRWKSSWAKVGFHIVLTWWAFVMLKEAVHIIVFLLVNGTQPGSL